MFIYQIITIRSLILSIALFSTAYGDTPKTFVAFPGKYPSKLISVEAANIINLYVEVWTGYPRKFRVTLPGIAIPTDDPEAPACQSELRQKALDFTNKFMSDAEYINVMDIRMENTGEEDSQANIFTNEGNLGAALTTEGLVRPASVKADKPWC